MAGPQRGSRVVFVGNIPYDMSEEQLTDVFREVGKVVGFRLVNDRDTGKFKGYGFCEFEDPETAASAVRNLNEVEVGGRPLRISFADIDPLMEGRTTQHGNFDQDDLRRRAAAAGRAGRPGTFGHAGGPGGPPRGGGAVCGGWQQRGPADGGFGQRQFGGPPGGQPYGGPGGPPMGGPPGGFGGVPSGGAYTLPPNLPAGVPLPAGVGSTDAITETLATLPPNQLLDIMSQMKSLVASSPEQARALLTGHPQLAYALFQAMLMMNVVDPDILQRILAASGAVPGAAAPPPSVPPHMQQQPTNNNGSATPPQHYGGAPPGGRYPPQARPPPAPYAQPGYGGQPPAPANNDPAAALAGQNLPEEQKALLMQVLQLTPDQINALPPDQKASILQLKAQFGQA
ncbi:Cleavage stimulation factor subunit 2, hinge domain protein [Kalmanozyma brasiliensis GHG001]|uniref:mRNA cleavage and polyadenylation factor I complex, subunit RNA15 n=1 Tax=Kalmanozyma brasiliensis (strain GHG001) TaxID=1365824 RepID=V5EQG6_KALBG|nr:Cleavage stimulation factor subunit 2, hinge domain protein [Kalmanozyma brasiliensis GHG001]EST05173.1 Cleavage stimulation factor subunit 2, hinge domain protein [Kalmanozyma brasiliensis GHG001]